MGSMVDEDHVQLVLYSCPAVSAAESQGEGVSLSNKEVTQARDKGGHEKRVDNDLSGARKTRSSLLMTRKYTISCYRRCALIASVPGTIRPSNRTMV